MLHFHRQPISKHDFRRFREGEICSQKTHHNHPEHMDCCPSGGLQVSFLQLKTIANKNLGAGTELRDLDEKILWYLVASLYRSVILDLQKRLWTDSYVFYPSSSSDISVFWFHATTKMPLFAHCLQYACCQIKGLPSSDQRVTLRGQGADAWYECLRRRRSSER